MNARALAGWSAVGLVIALGGTNPVERVLVGLAALDLLVTRTPPERPLRPLLLGVVLAGGLAATLNLLLAHAGEHVLLTLPEALPLVGGPITLESAAFGAVTATGLMAAILVVAPLSLLLEPHDLLDALPARLERTGIAVATALNLVPTIRRTALGVMEAQRLRGWRPRGPWSWAEILVPVMLTAIEGSLQLAEAMEARAFGSGRRTRYEPRGLNALSRLTVGSAVAALGLYLAARVAGAQLDWQAYPTLAVPAVDPLATMACLALALPALPRLGGGRP